MGLKLYQAYFLSLLAEAYGQTGQPEHGLQVLAEAATLIATTEVRWWEPEVSRLQGELLPQLPHPDVSQIAACFHHALTVARAQQATALELRAAMSLSRLWQQQGKRERPVSSWRRFIAGSPRALTRPICTRPRRYAQYCREANESIKTLGHQAARRAAAPLQQAMTVYPV